MLVNLINICYCVMKNYKVVNWCKYTNADDVVATTGMNNIKELLNICDILHVYDNTEKPLRIIRKHKDDLSIYPNEYWSEQDILKLIE
mgnify:FL=1